MLTDRQNLLETIRGGNPDRYVNQFEAFALQYTPQDIKYPEPTRGGEPTKSCWGVTNVFPEHTPGTFPLEGEYLVIKDIANWKDYVTMPSVDFTEEEWKPLVESAKSVNRDEQFVTSFLWPGLFENAHHLLGIEECMMALYDEPDAMHELIEFMKEYELKLAEQICIHIRPDAIYRHDDWGSQKSLFLSKDMFREFFLEPTKEIYQFYKKNGVELIVHHSDSYGETLVPEMIEMGIDIWQGALSTNNIPEILKEFGGQISIMGGINNGIVDKVDWSDEVIMEEVERVCRWSGNRYFIPGLTNGGTGCAYQGVYASVSKGIDCMSKKIF